MCLRFIFLRGCTSPTSILMFEESYLEGGYEKRGVYLPGDGVPACVAVLIAGRGSPTPPAVPWWGGRGRGVWLREVVLVVRGCRAVTLCRGEGLRGTQGRGCRVRPRSGGWRGQTTKEIVCFFNGFGPGAQLGRER